ncbi:MAG: VWA domain-containing protein [Planctomycetota bacterium]|nr:VWA domain-containing protein [Planctomycetota bacterium]
MFIGFFQDLRRAGVPVTLREFLLLLRALREGVAQQDVEHFYYLARSCLVKDERYLDRFDLVFQKAFEGLESLELELEDLPEEWLRKIAERWFTEEEMQAAIQRGGFDELMEELRKRLAEQEERHQGGSKWVGTMGTSPFGAWGYNPMGVRIGQNKSRHRRAIKVWDQREFRDFDDTRELGTRNLKIALRRLRKLVREGREEELDLPGTIKATANNAGWLDLKMQKARTNAVKVLLFLDVGGSMDDHVMRVEELFSAARAELVHLEHFYFHNCLYERVWKQNVRRWGEVTPTLDLLRTYGEDYRVIFVGDASMGPYEITEPGASVEHWNDESGATWMRRVLRHWPRAIWLNPVREDWWRYTESIAILHRMMEGRMFPLTLEGLDAGLKELT